MATQLFLNNAIMSLRYSGFAVRVAGRSRGALINSLSNSTTSGGTWISLGFWSTAPLEPFTLSGSISFNLWGFESNNTANASLGLRLYKYNSSTGFSASLGQATNTTELGTSSGVVTASVTPTSTAFDAGDILAFEVGAVNVGTMGAGRTVTVNFNNSAVGADGDSYVTITENIVERNRVRIFG